MSNRRNFLRNSLLGTAAITAAPALANERAANEAAPAAPKSVTEGRPWNEIVNRNAFKPMPVSCLSYSFNATVREGMMDIFHYFETCRYRYNIDAADLWNGMITQVNDDAYIDKVHRALQERQLVVPGIAADGAHLISAPTRDTPEDRARLRGIQDRYMEICRKWGVGFLRLDAGPLQGGGVANDTKDPWSPADFDYLVRRYRELAQRAYDWGFMVGNENHFTYSKWWPNMQRLIQAVDHPGFGICVHFGGWTPNSPETHQQDNNAADQAAARWIAHTHITWEYTENSELLLAKMNMLREAGYRGYYNAECHSSQNEHLVTGIMIERIKAVLNSWNIVGPPGYIFPQRNR